MSLTDTHGVINLIKPIGVGSTDLVAYVKRLLKVSKVGHGGTLDPFACGVLPIGINRGTKSLQSLLEGDKSYTGTAVLGMETDSLDIEGDATGWHQSFGKEHTIRTQEVLSSLMGTRLQTTPLYSARRVEGKRLYHIARNTPELQPAQLPKRQITVHDLQIQWDSDYQKFHLQVRCSKGTYIRQIVQEIAEQLGIVAYLDSLCRTEVAGLSLQNAISVAKLFEIVHKGADFSGQWFHRVQV
jgi:tRNA pseudouridine55 synthase